MRFLMILSLLSLSTSMCEAQPKRALADMLDRLTELNFEMLKGSMNVEKSKLNVTPAPFLPTVSASANQQQRIEAQAANTLSLGADVSWRLFDGGGMFYRYNASKQSLKSEQLRFFMNFESLSSELFSQYSYIISLSSNLQLSEQSVRLSRERYAEAAAKYNIGAGSGLEMRLAKTDLNADSTSLVKAREELEIAYVTMNEILRYDLADRGYVEDTIIVERGFVKDSLLGNLDELNTQILLSRSGEMLSELDLKTARAARYPTLDFGAAYNLGLKNNSPAEHMAGLHNGTWGFSIGVKLFDGMEITRSIRTAKLDKDIATLTVQQVQHQVLSDFERKWVNYQNNLRLIDFERENALAMELNLQIAMQRYRLGDLSGIDFRNIQLQFLSAEQRKISTLYRAKVSEIELLTLSGLLL